MTGQRPGWLDDLDDLTLRTVAVLESTSPAKLRRAVMADWCVVQRQDPAVAEIVRLMQESRAKRDDAEGLARVVELRRRPR